jgi:hypothetical protein
VTDTPPVADVVCQVRRLLETIGDGLVSGCVEPLLEAERGLGPALHALASLDHTAPKDPDLRDALRRETDRCRAALERCRRLGASFEDLAGAALARTGRTGAYGAHGEPRAVAPAGTLQVRG